MLCSLGRQYSYGVADAELAALLERFGDEYNDRPHQGLAVPGLSPNEFARRITNT